MKVTDFRLTCIWNEALPAALGPTDIGRLGACVRGRNYAALFKDLLDNDADPLLTVPWPRRPGKRYPESNHFWSAYLVDKLRQGRPSDAGDIGWASVAPFRRKTVLARLRHGRRSFVEGWFHPHGVALTATLWCRGAFDAAALRHEATGFLSQPLTVTWPDGKPQTLGLSGLAKACLETLRAEAFSIATEFPLADPMRVLTVVGIQDESMDTPQTEQHMLAAALDCIGGKPGAGSQPAEGSDIHMTSRGRLVWRPDKARATPGDTHTLACLHRNLVVVPCQTAGLIAGVEAALGALQQAQNAMPPRIEAYLRNLAKQLEMIHTGAETYDQACLRRQTETAKATLDKLRGALGWKALP